MNITYARNLSESWNGSDTTIKCAVENASNSTKALVITAFVVVLLLSLLGNSLLVGVVARDKEALSMEQMNRYASPINPAVFPHLTIVLLSIGIFFMAWFFVYEVTSTKYNRDIYKELLVSLVASLFMGFGVLFLLLWVGIYV